MVGATATAVVLGSASAAFATPATPPDVSAVTTSLRPMLVATATDGYVTGAQSLKFYARHTGASSWDLLNGQTVSGTSGTATLPARLAIEDGFEYRVEHCDSTGCTSSPVQSDNVSALLGAGDRPGATTVPFTLGDRIAATVDVGSGNLKVEIPQLTLPRVAGDLAVGAVYNSISRYNLDFDGSLSSGWRVSTGSDVYLRTEPVSGVITYHGPNSTTGLFTPTGSGAYASPAGFKMDLHTAAGGGWTLWQHDSGETSTFNSGGQLTTLTDRNGNATTFGYAGTALTGITGDQGPTAARTLTVTTEAGTHRITGIAQNPGAGSGLAARSVSYGYNGVGQLTDITDALGRTTVFTYSTDGNLASVTAPGGAVTGLTYDALGRVTTITQPTATAATAVTRLAYTATTTTLAEPNTDQFQAVSAVPHTTYTLTGDGNKLIASAVDPAGKTRSATYTPLYDLASATDPAGTTTASHGANSGESLTGVTGPTSATSSLSYGASGTTRYLPAGGTDPQGNASAFAYNGAGNRLSATDAASNAASVTYNTDATIATSTAPGGAVTSYGYNGDRQLTSMTPPTGTSLAGEAYTWDGYGRLATVTDGRGVITSYGYDALDRVTDVSYSVYGTTVPATTPVSYSYNTAGYLATRTDASGTTTFGYDQLGRLTSRSNSANAGGVSYSYDQTGNLATATNAAGTTSYGYDDRNLVTVMTPADGRVIRFGYDDAGRRTDTWFKTDSTHSTWAAHSHTDYDAAGQISRIWTAQASSDTTRVSDLSYAYTGNTDAGRCPTAPSTTTALRWAQTDNVTGVTTHYCYDAANRLTLADPGTAGPTTYSYDADGNRLQTVHGSTTVTQTVNAADQLTMAGYSYDAAGNTTADGHGTETWNAADQLTSLTNTSGSHAYTYAGTDQTELITDGNGRTFTYGRTGATGLPLVESFTKNGNTYAYLYDPTGTPLAIEGGNTHYLALDGLGSVVATINHSATVTATYSHDPWGTMTATAQNGSSISDYQLYGYTGGIPDNPTTTLLHLGHRWYDTQTGRFTQRDDIQTLADPTRANRYQYAGSNPVTAIDPTGDASTTYGGQVCYYVCLGLSYTDGAKTNGLSVSWGIGGGIGGGVSFSDNDPTSGLSGPALSCSASIFGFTYEDGKFTSGGIGNAGGGGVGCSITSSYTWTW